MKKFLTYLLIIVVAVAIIGGVYWLLTCPATEEVTEKNLPTLEEMEQKAEEAIANSESYTAPYDLEMVVKDEGVSIIVNQIMIILAENEGKEVADELVAKVNGNIVGFVPAPDTYQIELQTSTIDELESALKILRSDDRVKAAIKNTLSRISN